MKIGVTGAFGFLGAATVAAFLEEPLSPDQRIIAFGSRSSRSALFDPARVDFRRIDILDKASLLREFSGLDMLLHFAGKVGFSAREAESVWRVNVEGARSVFEAVLEARVPFLVNISSVSALGPAPDGRLLCEDNRPYDDEGTPWMLASRQEAVSAARKSGRDETWNREAFLKSLRCVYLDSKLAALELARDMRDLQGLPVVNIMPGTAIGEGEAHEGIGKLLRTMASGRLALVASGVCPFMDSRDFAKGVRLAALKAGPGQDYILAGPKENNLDFTELRKIVAKVTGNPAGFCLAAPRKLALAAATIAELLTPGLGLSRGLVESGSVRVACDSSKAMRELGYDPGTPLEESVRRCLRPGS
jgi:nucleoside-diphosphate-sugar epimerase